MRSGRIIHVLIFRVILIHLINLRVFIFVYVILSLDRGSLGIISLSLRINIIFDDKYRINNANQRMKYDLASAMRKEHIVAEEDIKRLFGD